MDTNKAKPVGATNSPDEWQERTRTILGNEGADQLHDAHVLVAGVGGVGGFAVEALVRAGVGRLTLIDADTVSLTNLNRQISALLSTLGQPKVDVIAQRIADINPQCRVTKRCLWLTAETITEELEQAQPDYVIDCIDTMPAKLELLETALRRGIPVIASMGTGGKVDPSLLRLADISKTTVCPLARKVRSGLRLRGITRGLEVLFSPESPRLRHPQDGDNKAQQWVGYGTVSFLPSCAGLILAGRVIRVLAGLEPFPPSVNA